jgi:hypothetical protein
MLGGLHHQLAKIYLQWPKFDYIFENFSPYSGTNKGIQYSMEGIQELENQYQIRVEQKNSGEKGVLAACQYFTL